MNSIGIMQGRLTRPNNRGIQFFPFENWENEFYVAARLQLDEIEFIFDYESYEANPLFSPGGIKRIKEIIEITGVKVNSVCLDYFMRRPFYKFEESSVRRENKEMISRIINSTQEIGGAILEIPLVDGSSLKTPEERSKCVEFLREMASLSDITLNLETDLYALEFKQLLNEINCKNICANYDSGNSSGLGYDLYEEIKILKESVTNIHIKDRLLGGATVALGTGGANFLGLFKGLKETGYEKSFILQAARGAEGHEEETVKKQIAFLKEYINNYLSEK